MDVGSPWPGTLRVQRLAGAEPQGLASLAPGTGVICLLPCLVFGHGFWGSNSWPRVSRQALYP